MRHSTAHLVVAFCSSMAVTAAPLSPLPPGSPALLSPSLTPRSTEAEDMENKDREPAVKQKRSVGGFAYHTPEHSMISRSEKGEDGVVTAQHARVISPRLNYNSDSDSTSSSESENERRSVSSVAARSILPREQSKDKNVDPVRTASIEDSSFSKTGDNDLDWQSDDSLGVGSEGLDAGVESASFASDDEDFNADNISSANEEKAEAVNVDETTVTKTESSTETLNVDESTVAETANSAQNNDEVKAEATKRSVGLTA